MSSPIRQEAASRHHPIAHQRSASQAEASGRYKRHDSKHPSEPRLQAGVSRPPVKDEKDPYADVPCTD